MAYGTRTVPRVDKIVGPGNRWVSAAKSLVSSDCGIDFYAGPTEILIVTASGSPAWIAADLLAQAEHDPDARAVLITTSRRLAERVAARWTDRCLPPVPRGSRSRGTAASSSAATMNEAIALANDAAAEHVVAGNESIARRVARMPARCSSASGRRRWPATTRSDRITSCRRPAPRAIAAG